MRSHFAEFGVVVAKGAQHAAALAAQAEDSGSGLPETGRTCLAVLVEELWRIDERIHELGREISRRAKADAAARRLMTIPGIGPVTATALLALAPAAETFRLGRDFAAWLGLTPMQRSTGVRNASDEHRGWENALCADC